MESCSLVNANIGADFELCQLFEQEVLYFVPVINFPPAYDFILVYEVVGKVHRISCRLMLKQYGLGYPDADFTLEQRVKLFSSLVTIRDYLLVLSSCLIMQSAEEKMIKVEFFECRDLSSEELALA